MWKCASVFGWRWEICWVLEHGNLRIKSLAINLQEPVQSVNEYSHPQFVAYLLVVTTQVQLVSLLERPASVAPPRRFFCFIQPLSLPSKFILSFLSSSFLFPYPILFLSLIISFSFLSSAFLFLSGFFISSIHVYPFHCSPFVFTLSCLFLT
jgi:hypothetical protein